MNVDTYRRARAEGLAASYAATLARLPAAEEWGTNNRGDLSRTFDADGFRIVATATYDEGMTLADLGYGRVEGPPRYWDSTYRPPMPEPGCVWIGDSRKGGPGWYVPSQSLADRVKYARQGGASRSVALDIARAGIVAEASDALDDYGPTVYVVTVAARREGVELSRDAVGGVEVGWNTITRDNGELYLDEIVADILPGVVEEARATIARLTT